MEGNGSFRKTLIIEEDESLADEDIKCSDIKNLKTEYWCSVGCNLTSEATITNSIVLASAMMQSRFNYDEEQAGFYQSLPYTCSLGFSLAVGYIADKWGVAYPIAYSGAIILLGAHLTFLLMPECE